MIELAKRLLLAVAIAFAGMGGAASADKTINIGWTAWSDAETVTTMVKKLLESRLGYKVRLTLSDIAIQYNGVARGDLDLMLMSWLPETHRDYLERVGGDVVNLGILYTGARLGWVVPAYVPKNELGSIGDLAKASVRDKLRGKIHGIDPGAGLMRLSKKAVKAYALDDYELIASSGAGMTAALKRAFRRKRWIVVTGWSPHWMFGAYKLRYLSDPKGTLGGLERVHAIARRGFYREHPKAAAMVARMFIPLDELQAVMYAARDTSYEQAVADYIRDHPKRIDYWVTGNL